MKQNILKNFNKNRTREEKLAFKAIKEFEKDRKTGRLLTGTKAEDLFNLEKVC